MSASASGASAKANGDAKHRAHTDGSEGRAFTPEQKAAVIRVRKCSATAFYDILGLETVKATCTDSEIKKAYRKLSLLTHPDKNGYSGADEAFKMVSRAFQILSDPDKKSKFDKFGGDPDSRFGGGSASSASPFSGFSQAGGRRGGMFEEEISPEEMFARFFGGGGMGGGFGGPFGMFDTGPGFAFNMGGPGIRVHQFGGARPQRRPRDPNAPPQSSWQALQSLLPILVIFLFPLISSVFNSLFPDAPAGPTVRLNSPSPPMTEQHVSYRLKIPYWVNPADVNGFSSKDWRRLDEQAEKHTLTGLQYECEAENDRRTRMVEDAMGFFFTDNEKLKKARDMPMPACSRLEGYGYRGRR